MTGVCQSLWMPLRASGNCPPLAAANTNLCTITSIIRFRKYTESTSIVWSQVFKVRDFHKIGRSKETLCTDQGLPLISHHVLQEQIASLKR